MAEKTLIVYCSILNHNTPPFSWYNFARKLSDRVPVIFIELSNTSSQPGFRKNLQYFRWFLQTIRHPKTFLLWNFNSILSPYFLRFYLLFLKLFHGYQIILFTNLPETFRIYRSIPSDLFWFDCNDQYSVSEFQKYRQQIQKFDMVFTNTKLMFSLMKQITSKIKLISSGYYENQPKTKHPLPKISKSIIFSGGISVRIDYRLIQKLATLLPDYQFFFIGDVYLQKHYFLRRDKVCLRLWNQLLKLPNIHYLGAFLPAESVRLLSLFEIGIIPYDTSDVMNYHCHPIKLYEYLVAGLPVISTPIPSVAENIKSAPIYIADSASSMAKTIRNISFNSTSKTQHNIKKILRAQSIERKVEQITNFLPAP